MLIEEEIMSVTRQTSSSSIAGGYQGHESSLNCPHTAVNFVAKIPRLFMMQNHMRLYPVAYTGKLRKSYVMHLFRSGSVKIFFVQLIIIVEP